MQDAAQKIKQQHVPFTMCPLTVPFDTGETREPLCGLGAVPAPALAGMRLCSRSGVGTGWVPTAQCRWQG